MYKRQFIIPIFVSWYLVFFTDFKKEDGGTQKGEIISPVISLGELEDFDIKNDTVSSTNDNWTLVFFVKPECSQFCEDKLYEVRQIRLALGKDRDCLLYTSPSPRDAHESRMPSSA